MVRRVEAAEPHPAQLSETRPLFDAGRQNPVERADPVAGDEQESVAEVIDVADLPRRMEAGNVAADQCGLKRAHAVADSDRRDRAKRKRFASSLSRASRGNPVGVKSSWSRRPDGEKGATCCDTSQTQKRTAMLTTSPEHRLSSVFVLRLREN